MSIASDDPSQADEAEQIVRSIIFKSPVRCFRAPLNRFEHGAMVLVDELASQDLPVLYFHAKAVSYNPPKPFAEVWRKYLNRLVVEADHWAQFLTASHWDVCGQLLVNDPSHGYAFFGGNFWLAKAAYLRTLPRCEEFAASSVGGGPVFDRHLAELAINRNRSMKAFVIDGTSLTPDTMISYLYNATSAGSASKSGNVR